MWALKENRGACSAMLIVLSLCRNMEIVDYKSFREGKPVLYHESIKYIKTFPNDIPNVYIIWGWKCCARC